MIYLGSMGWSYDFWKIYEDVPSSEYLTRYSQLFNSVEVNSTFYRIPRKTSVENWRDQTPDRFKFSVKIPRSISHSKDLEYDIEKLDAFLDHIKPFDAKLGPLLLQLPPKLTPEHSEQLDLILTQLKHHKTAVEFRHKDWFTDTTYDMLREYNTALVYVEPPWQPTAMVETADFNYIRLEGDRRKVDGEKGIVELDRTEDNQRWAERIKNTTKDVYLYVSKYYSGNPPSDIKMITSRLPRD